MAERHRGVIERLVDWFTVEVPEPDGVQAWPGDPPETPGPCDPTVPDTAVQGEGDPPAVAEDAVPQAPASPGPTDLRGPLAALGLTLTSVAGRLHDGWLAVTDAVGQAVTGIAQPTRHRPQVRRGGAGATRPARRRGPHPFPAGRVGIVLALLVALALAARLAGHPHARAPQADGPAVPGAHDIAVARADAAAATAVRAAADARAAGRKVTAQLTAARQAGRQVTTLSAPALARQPSAQDPAKPLATLQLMQTQAAGAVGTIGRDVRAAESGAAAATGVPAAAQRGAAAAADAKVALSAAQGAAREITALVPPAQHAAATWHQIHTAPPGTLGVTTRDPPAAWRVRGCEVLAVAPGGAGQQLGLTGAAGPGRTVGDVVTLVRDATDGNASWPTASCAGLKAAMAQSRAGDRITVSYEHRATMDLLLGFWLSDTGTVVLGQGGAARRVCPAALSGHAGAGGTVPLTLTLSGPAGTRRGVAVTLDPAGAASFFPDALLRALGYRPYRSQAGSGVVPGSRATVNLYDVPGASLTVDDGGQRVALAGGILSVVGTPGGSAAGLGGAVLRQGAQLVRHGTTWSLTPPCH